MVKKLLLAVAGIFLAILVVGAAFALFQIRAFDRSMSKVYEVSLRTVNRSTEPTVLERGKHLAESLGACLSCHGPDGSGGKGEDLMPIARLMPVNITSGNNGALARYTDSDVARLVEHGIRRDGTSARFMPSSDFAWWPQSDVDALISYLRTLPPVDTGPAEIEVGAVGKVLDRLDMMPLDVARRIDHDRPRSAPIPEPTKEYGKHLATLCVGCHGETLSGGALPGSPPSLPTPLNLTPHETGLKGWTFADFESVLRRGIRKDGAPLNPFMPIDATKNFNDTEMTALWAYLQSVPPKEFGHR